MKIKPLTFISLQHTDGQTSSLAIHGIKKNGELTMSVVGGLSHNTDFTPKSIDDCDKLIEFLKEWRKTQI